MPIDPATVAADNDAFDKMFDDLSKLKAGPAPGAAVPVVEPVVPAVVDPVVPAVVDPVVPVVVDPVVPAVVDPVVPPAEPTTRELLERFTDIIAKQQPTAPLAPVAPAAPNAVALYSDAELSTLAAVQKDFPDLFASMELMLRGALTKNNEHTFSEIAKVLTPVSTTVEAVSANQMLSELRRAIPDYNTVYQPVVDWVKTQPAYLQKAYVSVIEEGTVPEITDLVERWRTSTGKPAVAAAAVVPPKPANELSEAAKQAALALAPVVSQRTVHTPSAPTTFDEAFEAFSKKP